MTDQQPITLPNNSQVATELTYDLLVIGGGINGVGVARDAAGRGLRVLLVEQGDLAQSTSSASSKLIHGGLRYLEYYEFRLVRESLLEREILLKNAPHIIWPMRFVMPHNKLLRPAWMIRLGLFLYDHLAPRRKLPGSNGVRLRKHQYGYPLKSDLVRGFVYSDCWVQDSRLVALNAKDAQDRGVVVKTRTKCTEAVVDRQEWLATLLDKQTGQQRQVRAKMLINTAGPWVDQFLTQALQIQPKHRLRLVKGSHIIVPKLYEGSQAYILQNNDRRVIFVIPYEEKFTLIGTTDLPVDESTLDNMRISPEEVNYLCQAVNQYFKTQITAQDVVSSYAGVRPLYDDAKANASAVTRDYVLQLHTDLGAPLLSVYGGKITTYRRLAEHVMQKIHPFFPNLGKSWTAKTPLPGGNITTSFTEFCHQLSLIYPWLPKELCYRYARAYGDNITVLLKSTHSIAELGLEILPGLYEQEIAYLKKYEFAKTAEDILWRRSKLGLHLPSNAVEKLQKFLDQQNSVSKSAI